MPPTRLEPPLRARALPAQLTEQAESRFPTQPWLRRSTFTFWLVGSFSLLKSMAQSLSRSFISSDLSASRASALAFACLGRAALRAHSWERKSCQKGGLTWSLNDNNLFASDTPMAKPAALMSLLSNNPGRLKRCAFTKLASLPLIASLLGTPSTAKGPTPASL